MGLFGFGKKEKDKMKDGLEKTRTGFWGNILNTLTGSKIDDDLYDELEEQLILADVGGDVAMKLVDALRDRVQEKGLKTGEQAADALRDIIADEMRPETEMALDGHPAVILVIGVNGVGKTTSIAKLADYYTRQGKKVMLAAGDTFRAAASEQLEIWAGRAGVPIVKAGEGADPAAVIFDTVKSATARGYDMVIADTAGRLHNKSNLMSELSKISRSVRKAAPEASLETLLVLDAITGQNAISQAKEFCKAADATGIILTKLDGTSRTGEVHRYYKCATAKKPKVTEEFIRFWLLRFRKLDMSLKDRRQALVDTFINAIYLYDDKVLITFNYKKGTQTVTFGEATEVASEGNSSDLDCFAALLNGSFQKAAVFLLPVVLLETFYQQIRGLEQQLLQSSDPEKPLSQSLSALTERLYEGQH